VPDTPWLTVKEAAQIIKCGPKLIYREVTAGRLRAARIGNRRDLRIHRSWVDEWLEASAKPVIVHTRGVA
jgi:excisionase family DNA binding protein